MPSIPGAQIGVNYLDMQAYVGITKHNGGREATDELLTLCHVENAREVPNVGCGIGISSAYIARKHGCRVVGTDISEKMSVCILPSPQQDNPLRCSLVQAQARSKRWATGYLSAGSLIIGSIEIGCQPVIYIPKPKQRHSKWRATRNSP